MPQVIRVDISNIKFCATFFNAKPKQSYADKNTLLICLPGGGASADYFDLAPGHSFVDRMTSAGYALLTIDHPGTATNLLPDDYPFLTPWKSAQLIAQSLNAILPEIIRADTCVIGVGHSMGGMMVTLVQKEASVFQGLALFGSSAGGLDWGLSEEERTYIDDPIAFARDIETLTLKKFRSSFPEDTGGPSGKSITFGGETVSLTNALKRVSCPLFAAGGMMSMVRGSFRDAVRAIDVPIFFAFGDHDIGIPPKDVPKDYKNARSTELVILENTGHNHFAFSSIHTLCDRLNHWISNAV